MAGMVDELARRVARRYLILRAGMIDLETARRAKDALRAQLRRPAWLTGVGIGIDKTGSHNVRVMVAEMSDDVRRAVPRQIEGVPIVVDVTGNFELQ
jgi:hypothetical protein